MQGPCCLCPMLREGVYTAEDVAFCRNWRAIGGKIFADPQGFSSGTMAEKPSRATRWRCSRPVVAATSVA